MSSTDRQDARSAAQGRNWPRLLWLGWRWHFNVHRDEFCHLCFTVGPVGFRWHR